MSGIDIEQTIRDFWATRPVRRADDRKISGVAAAIGRRYGVDPVLVRVAFVVAAFFGGAGVMLYLLGWLFLPDEGDQVSAAEGLLGRGHSSVSPALTVVLGLAFLLVAGSVFGGNAYGVVGLAAAVVGLYALHRSRAALGEIPVAGPATSAPDPGAGSADAGPASAGPASAGPASAGRPGAGGQAGTAPPTPPNWDPLGTAPFAWDLPEPAPVPPAASAAPRPPRSKITPITLGLALLAGGIAAAFGLPVAQIAAIALAVIGLGMVLGSVLRGGRGLIAVAVPLTLLTWVLQAAPIADFTVGQNRWNPVTVDQVRPHYDLAMGEGVLDLTGLRVPDGQTVTTSARVGAGQMRILLPPNLDAQVSCQVPLGQADCLGRTTSSIPARLDVSDPGSDGPGGGKLALEVSAGAGQVVVTRGGETR